MQTVAEVRGVAAVVAQAPIVLIGPTSRYVTGPCCDNPSHLDNIGKEEYEEDTLDILESHKKLLTHWAAVSDLTCCFLSATSLVNPIVTALKERTNSYKDPCR